MSNAKDYRYLNQSGCIQVPKINDADEYEKIKAAMHVLNFGAMEQTIFGVLAAVLHLGNVQFVKKAESSSGEGVDISNLDGEFFLKKIITISRKKNKILIFFKNSC